VNVARKKISDATFIAEDELIYIHTLIQEFSPVKNVIKQQSIFS